MGQYFPYTPYFPYIPYFPYSDTLFPLFPSTYTIAPSVLWMLDHIWLPLPLQALLFLKTDGGKLGYDHVRHVFFTQKHLF